MGLRTNMTVTGETAVQYLYDTVNRLTNVTQGTFSSSLFYDDAGRRTNLTLPSGIKVVYRYDNASRLTNITYLAAVTNKIDYTYDEVGNRSSQSSALATYLLPLAVTNSTYNSANQQTVFGSYNILYDANGNVTNIVSGTTTNKLVWSPRNQLTNMTGAVTAFFLYDGLGRRITRTVSSNTEKYLYDGLDTILQEDSGGAVQARYFRGLGIDEPWLRSDIGAATTNRTYYTDALGSTVALTDTNKVIQTEYDYQPFGATTTTGASNKNAHKFTGREDDGTGLHFYRARYYQPALARFVSEDPIEYAGGDLNLYAYVLNSPLLFIDPWGWVVTIQKSFPTPTPHVSVDVTVVIDDNPDHPSIRIKKPGISVDVKNVPVTAVNPDGSVQGPVSTIKDEFTIYCRNGNEHTVTVPTIVKVSATENHDDAYGLKWLRNLLNAFPGGMPENLRTFFSDLGAPSK